VLEEYEEFAIMTATEDTFRDAVDESIANTKKIEMVTLFLYCFLSILFSPTPPSSRIILSALP
jgi:hypothetical protein